MVSSRKSEFEVFKSCGEKYFIGLIEMACPP